MRFRHLKLENWRNFLKVDIDFQQRAFFVGPNASGKSNLLDAFRFLRDIANPEGGGLQRAVVQDRRGVAQLRSLHARRYSNVVIEAVIDLDQPAPWTYRLEFNQDAQRTPIVKRELVLYGDVVKLNRPDDADKADPKRLTQTNLEQVNANKDIRDVASFFAQIRYMHLVPQLVRRPDHAQRDTRDPYGRDFLEQLARTQPKILNSRLDRIRDALQVAVPQLKELKLARDKTSGIPHLYGRYEHWRKNAGWQTEEEFSDGTLRLLGLLWALLDGTAPLLLEEPELSLHSAVVRFIPRMMAKLGKKAGRQVLVSTHSADMLTDPGIAPEVICLFPTKEGTDVRAAEADEQVRALLEGGVPVAEAVLPRTAPRNTESLSLFGD